MDQGGQGQDRLANRHQVRTPLHAKALIEELDHKQLVVLRDGRKIVGLFRSCDQFANLVFQDPYERIIVGKQYCDIPLGSIYLLRGENVVLMGRIDDGKEYPLTLQRVSPAEIRKAQEAEKEEQRIRGTMLKRLDFLELE
ncbi:Sm-like protein LSm1 [Chloropicon primus]|uniref:U6 snRNA-associated Sm-like protein LSm1 n=1 Tax=Chloropicon primus TaxID=1764295 RepID=A0A5B8MEN6_9CHLO|nr:Sm-like protein LSm1 [Chloropicon primus]UPQ96989.1 Sm-like protein LSm1 [Chloropicon primus]|eukprot:QDZ17772.1 Sm-like protein LSm1 [Chloropicon primus]